VKTINVPIRSKKTYQSDDGRKIEEWMTVKSMQEEVEDDYQEDPDSNKNSLFIGLITVSVPELVTDRNENGQIVTRTENHQKEIKFPIDATDYGDAFSKYNERAKAAIEKIQNKMREIVQEKYSKMNNKNQEESQQKEAVATQKENHMPSEKDKEAVGDAKSEVVESKKENTNEDRIKVFKEKLDQVSKDLDGKIKKARSTNSKSDWLGALSSISTEGKIVNQLKKLDPDFTWKGYDDPDETTSQHLQELKEIQNNSKQNSTPQKTNKKQNSTDQKAKQKENSTNSDDVKITGHPVNEKTTRKMTKQIHNTFTTLEKVPDEIKELPVV